LKTAGSTSCPNASPAHAQCAGGVQYGPEGEDAHGGLLRRSHPRGDRSAAEHPSTYEVLPLPTGVMTVALEKHRSELAKVRTASGWEDASRCRGGKGSVRTVGVDGEPLAVVCEDDPALAAALKSVLATHGVQVVATVERGADLLAAVAEHDLAVVVVDVALLGAQGVGRLTAVREASAARLVAVCPPGLHLTSLVEDVDVVIPGDDLRPLGGALAGFLGTPGVDQAAT
jgi:CheY-like chemotaxis protein